MRVGVIGLLQESNTFLAERTTLEKFQQDVLATGEAVRARFRTAHHEIGGFFAGLADARIDAVPIFVARALPFGVIADDAYSTLLTMLFAELARAGSLDGLLVAPHGATVSQSHPDADGYWLTRLRHTVGPKMPIVCTLDPHANLSEQMVAACDAIVAYRTNPHMDQKERGLEAARLLARMLRGEIRPRMAAAFPPLAINIECQLTAAPPCLGLYELADQQQNTPGFLSNSILLGFPYADVPEVGSAVLAVADGDPALARRLADELAGYLWTHRQEFVGRLTGIEQALDQAAKLDGPICLLDMGDNVGGGSPADSTALAHAIHKRRMPDAFVCLFDPQAVAQADRAGVGARVELAVGGRGGSSDVGGESTGPLTAEFTVLSLHDGRFEEPQPRHGGVSSADQGRTAVVRTEAGLTVMLTSRRMYPFSLRQLTTFGVEPEKFHILVAKGVIAPMAAYEAVCRHFIRVNTPGVTTADMARLKYRHRRRPMFPFESDTRWQPGQPEH
jgi:microcystin degradation protein MlrC